MKKLLILLVLAVSFASCSKKADSFDPVKQAADDDAAIQAYLQKNKIIDAIKDATGLYYRVVSAGTGVYPTSASTVTVNYTGTLLDGTQFDTTTGRGSFTTQLVNQTNGNPNVILGWVYGLQHIQAGGRIVLYIPSALGYAQYGSGSIAPNSVLIFTIDLISFR